ncbi:MAG TPA: peptidase T [Candidatus Flavonifractor merdipullorum]|uniref:Peptidase T n=1 Tax=Candidatus Flavonifractor merdipullorum TaxID=2838590 RepID=A0A9D1RW18_9FIRM|nr:peptidase T [Candidatus Flavonifractor merdipullorum]
MNAVERFLKYVTYDTQSDENSTTVPSTAKQKVLGEALAAELSQMGLQGAHLDQYGYVYAWLPATPGCEGVPCMGLIAHMDTSPDAPGANVKPRIVRYTGGDIVLNEEKGLVMKEADFESLSKYRGQDLIVTDGTTLLGADDKAGVAEILSAVEYLTAHPEIPHGRIAVGITPDEEVGQGADHFDVEGFGAAVAYTVDGGELGEIEYENFNAAGAVVTVHGVNIHPGSAKNKMKNALLIAHDYVGLLPPAETPAHTEGYEGFYHLNRISGDETQAVLHYIIRDHDRAKFEARKNAMLRAADYLNQQYGAGTVEVALKDQYYNMKEQIEPHMYLILKARAAMESIGITPMEVPIRGGTDGARLSYMGLPCPNLCTGGVNFHSVHEYIPTDALEKMTQVLVRLVTAEPKR